jgi:hypothetical protein
MKRHERLSAPELAALAAGASTWTALARMWWAAMRRARASAGEPEKISADRPTIGRLLGGPTLAISFRIAMLIR